MKVCLVILVVFCGIEGIFGATHSLQYFHMGSTGIPNIPEFVAVGMVDGDQIDYYDSNSKRDIPKQKWMVDNTDAAYWDRETQKRSGFDQINKVALVDLPKRFNQTEGIHIVQWMCGCELDDETGVTQGFDQYGYDGEDYISLDTNTLTWTAANQRGYTTKLKWDRDPAIAQQQKNYLENICIEGLKKYVAYGRESLEKKVPPKVSVLQRDTLSPGTETLLCQATGFFPRGVVVTWERDGQEVYENVELGEIMPNGDGTFQIRSTLRVSPEHLEKHKYTCTVQHSSLEDNVVMTWVSDPPSSNMPIIIGVVVAVIVLAVIAAVVVVVLRKRGGQTTSKTTGSKGAIYKPAPANEQGDGSSTSS